jgi:hypothetical protein
MRRKTKRNGRRLISRKGVSKRQRMMLDDLFGGVSSEEEIIEKHKIRRRIYERWLADENFVTEFQRRLQNAYRQGELFIARYSSVAAVKLIELIESKNAETARKACIDIITLMRPKGAKTGPSEAEQKNQVESPAELQPEVAGRLLAAISAEK